MVITYHGGVFVKVVFGDTTIAVNPISKQSKLKPARFGADVVLVSSHHEDVNGIEHVTHGSKQPLVIDGPGEYEVNKIFITGIPTKTAYGGEEVINTVYTILLEDMRLCFMGLLSSRNLPTDAKAAIGVVDVLVMPIGGKGTLSAADAHELAVSLEAKVIIPTLHDTAAGAKQLTTFLEEAGEKNQKPIDKLTLKKKDLDGKEGNVIVLSQ